MGDRPGLRRAALWGALALPVVALCALNAAEILHWLRTGHCPGGPMDRAAGPCGPLEFVGVVLLGGWAAFLVVPLLVIWYAAVGLGWWVVARRRTG